MKGGVYRLGVWGLAKGGVYRVYRVQRFRGLGFRGLGFSEGWGL